LARPNNGILKVNLLEVGLSAGEDSREGRFRVDVRWGAGGVGGVGGNEGTKSSNEEGRERIVGTLWVEEMEGRVSMIAGISVGEPCRLPT
jgi:hypothetical protein